MTRNAKPGLLRAVDGPMGAPQQFLGDSVRYNGKKVEIALYLAVFVTRDHERYVTWFASCSFGLDLAAMHSSTQIFIRKILHRGMVVVLRAHLYNFCLIFRSWGDLRPEKSRTQNHAKHSLLVRHATRFPTICAKNLAF